MGDLYELLDRARLDGAIAVHCPACTTEAGFHAPFLFLTGDDATAAVGDPGVVGVRIGPGYLVELYPDVFLSSDPERAEVRGRQDGSYGVVVCPSCGSRTKHRLRWPADAYYAVTGKGGVIWAFTREHAADNLAVLESLEVLPKLLRGLVREEALTRLPAWALEKDARRTLITALEALLA